MNDITIEVVNSDCIEYLKLIPDKTYKCIVIDPPYGVDFKGNYNDASEFVKKMIPVWLTEFYRVLDEDRYIFIYIPTKEVDVWVSEVKKVFNFKNLLSTQSYITNTMASVKNNFTFDLQLIIVACKGEGIKFNEIDWIPTSESWFKDKRNKNPKKYTYQYPSYIYHDLMRANVKPNKELKLFHLNQKNHELIQKLIELTTCKKEKVLDAFAGSGSTGIAALVSERDCTLIESNEDNYNVCVNRLKNFHQ